MTVGNNNMATEVKFLSEVSGEGSCVEGEPFMLMVQLSVANIDVQWIKNGKSLAFSSRYGCSFDRGYACVEFYGLDEDDSGLYKCAVVNSPSGTVESNEFELKVQCSEEDSAPGVHVSSKLTADLDNLEQNLTQMRMSKPAVQQSTQPPSFVSAPEASLEVVENDPIVLECNVEPSKDNNLSVQWLRDGKELSASNRVSQGLDRGLASLIIAYALASDVGNYVCVATNSLGKTESSPCDVTVISEQGIVTKSNLSPDSVAYLNSLDTCEDAGEVIDYRLADSDPEIQPPVFVIEPKSLEVEDKTAARFLVKVEGHPVPMIKWFFNDKPVLQDSNMRIHNDGPISVFDIRRCDLQHQGTVNVLAKNSQGEATTSAQLVVQPGKDFRPGLKHVRPENPMKRLSGLKKVTCSDELVNRMNRPKATAGDLVRLEQLSRNKGRQIAENETLEVENAYKNAQDALKSKSLM